MKYDGAAPEVTRIFAKGPDIAVSNAVGLPIAGLEQPMQDSLHGLKILDSFVPVDVLQFEIDICAGCHVWNGTLRNQAISGLRPRRLQECGRARLQLMVMDVWLTPHLKGQLASALNKRFQSRSQEPEVC